jgi:hypothetical protein
MRRLAIKLILFCGILEGLGRVNLTVLLAGTATPLAAVVCSDYVFRMRNEN